MYKKVPTDLKFAERELEMLKYWKENNIFKRSIESRDGNDVFTFYDGPPTANGIPHIGHVLTRVVKDIIPRHRTMKGYKVLRKAGWDTHGLPVELEVEKALGINGKPQIEEYGVEAFIKKCKESVWKYKHDWESISDRVGFWADMENPYITYENNYIESVWWSLKQIWDKGLIYKGHKVVPYCPRCGTALSSHEVAQGYKDVSEDSVYVKFKVKGESDLYFLAWTTTPWTLPSNVALTVNPDEVYVKVTCEGENYILAEALASDVLQKEYKVIEKYKGSNLAGIEYEPLFNFAKVDKKAWFVCTDNYVTLTDGTGIVHAAPAFGEDDARVGEANNLPFVQLVNEQGNFIDGCGVITGLFAKDADPVIIRELSDNGLLYKVEGFEHSYPFCWRCDTSLLYYARNTWFIRMSEMKKQLIANNRTVNWLPDNIKEGRFGNFLENVIDWGISRERYWGTPLPIWECDCGYRHMVGSIAELKEMSTKPIEDIELHKPYIDEVILRCPKCSSEMKRVTEVIDCWYDSGSMPFAQWHYPFENNEVFDENFPADFISEAVDQTRGWFYTLLAISTLLFDKSPYKNVIVLGLVLDKEGQKMSKHKGNVVDPWTVLDIQGADAVRWYFYSASAPWLPSRFYGEAVSECQRKFMGTLWNSYAFYVLYAGIDKFNPYDYSSEDAKLTIMDRWIISRLNSLIKTIDDNLENYRITESARAAEDFVDDLSNWYVRRSRERFWQKGMPGDKISAYMTLHTVLVELSKLLAPFIPFMSDEIYLNIVKGLENDAPDSVHMCDYPVSDPALIDKALEKNMDFALKVVTLGRACRNEANIKNRQPLATIYIDADFKMDNEFIDVVAEELNVKQVLYINNSTKFTTYKFKPQLKTLGPKYGKLIPEIGKYLAESDGDTLFNELKEQSSIEFNIRGTDIILSENDLLIETVQKEGYVSATENGLIITIDTNLSEGLIEEGFVREIISKVQTMRKDAGFEVQDRIVFGYGNNSRIAAIAEKYSKEIAGDILAKDISSEIDGGYVKKWNINGEESVFAVRKV